MDNQEIEKPELFTELNSEEAASVNGGCYGYYGYRRRYRRAYYGYYRPYRRYYRTSYYYPRYYSYYRTGYGCW
ncbi:hypothetical protein IQ264_24785 [Phormidium sp. LEGE 05292]|uniref:hypothetical protein n=1 Tax=[Phormidium] sp. LEGE 05292 TaxID=767427 RepID=UPI00188310B3|nr:hypothetical protein [Phormidium sp. LEGE 05292]MBE9228630.1 hypothetical protein [Phormidium sp. LEGE 05292]